MKFNLIALAGALATAKAHQLRTNVRKLDENQANNNGNNNYRAELDGSANISFAKCIEVSVQQEYDEDLEAAIASGTSKSVKSYAAFYTNKYAIDQEMMMVGLGDYVAAKVKASAMKAEKACETCREFEETCNPEEEEVEEEAEEEEEGEEEEAAEEGDEAEEGEGRKLATAIDSSFCYECQKNGCYVEEEEGEGQVNYEEQLAEFIENIAGCMQVENYADDNGNAAYIGLACGSHGDAAEFAVFTDEDCTVETNQVSASTVLASAGANENGVSQSQMLSFAAMYMQEAFTTTLSCEEVQYYDPNAEQDEGDNENNNQNGYEMTESCQEITEEALYIADCAAQDAAEEDEADEEDEQWYDFDVQDGGDLDEVCAVVNYKLNNGEKFDYFYNEKKQGTTYERGITGNLKSSSSGVSGWLIFFLVALFIGVPMFICSKMRNGKTKQADYYGGSFNSSDDNSVSGFSTKSMKSSAYKYKQYFKLWVEKMKSKFSRR